MPAERTKHEAWSVPGRPGYIENRRGTCRLRFGKVARSLGRPFVPENKKWALGILREYQDDRERSLLAVKLGLELPEKKKPTARRTLFTVVEEFEQVMYPNVAHFGKKMFERTFAYFFTADCEFEYEGIYKLIVAKNRPGKIADNTRYKYLQYLSRFFSYAVDRGYLPKNPIDTLGLPRRSKATGGEPYTMEQVAQIISDLRQHATSRFAPYAVAFMAGTGFRISEMMSLTRSEASRDYLPARGKGESRELPVSVVPGLRELINEILSLKVERRRTMLFPWSNPTTLRTELNRSLDRLKIPRKKQPIHAFRDTAIFWWENGLMWNRWDVIDAAGHSRQVNDDHYRSSPTGIELETRIEKRRKA